MATLMQSLRLDNNMDIVTSIEVLQLQIVGLLELTFFG